MQASPGWAGSPPGWVLPIFSLYCRRRAMLYGRPSRQAEVKRCRGECSLSQLGKARVWEGAHSGGVLPQLTLRCRRRARLTCDSSRTVVVIKLRRDSALSTLKQYCWRCIPAKAAAFKLPSFSARSALPAAANRRAGRPRRVAGPCDADGGGPRPGGGPFRKKKLNRKCTRYVHDKLRLNLLKHY